MLWKSLNKRVVKAAERNQSVFAKLVHLAKLWGVVYSQHYGKKYGLILT